MDPAVTHSSRPGNSSSFCHASCCFQGLAALMRFLCICIIYIYVCIYVYMYDYVCMYVMYVCMYVCNVW